MANGSASGVKSGARCLLETARDAGLDVCFANPGTTEMPLVAALDEVAGIRPILGLFEGVCTGAADGYGRMTGRPALTLLHLGPGFANGIANLHNARRANTPIVNLVGDQASWHLESDAPLTSDIESLARPVSCWVRTTNSAKRCAADVALAIGAATAAPGGVATCILPSDHLAEDGGESVAARAVLTRPRVSGEAVEAVARKLREAGSRAVILLGGAALSAAGQTAAARIGEATGAAVLVETFPARWERGGDLPAFARLPYFPEQARAALASAEVVVLAGARDPVAFFGYPGQPSRLAPADTTLALAPPGTDAERALAGVAEAIGAPERRTPSHIRAQSTVAPAQRTGTLDAAAVGAILAQCLPEDAIVVEEAATSSLPFYAASTAAPRHTVLTLTGGAIGQGLPVATGAAVACPGRKVISFQADGSAAYTLQALWTQVREGLDVLTLLCSNRAYRILQVELARAGVSKPGPNAMSLTRLDAPAIDWTLLARGFGMPATRVETPEALLRELPRALATPGPYFLELSLA